MSDRSASYEEGDDVRDRSASDSDRLPEFKPLHEAARGDGYRWASLTVTDLDPPTLTPP